MGGRGATSQLKSYKEVITYAKFKQQIDNATDIDAIDKEILKNDPNYKISKYYFADKPRDTVIQLYVKDGKYVYDIYKNRKSVAKGLTQKQAKETVAKITANTRFFKLLKQDRMNRRK